jgi:hypothetical protein
MTLQWSPESIHDLIALHILYCVEYLLLENPKLGAPGRVPGTRELVIPKTPYIVTSPVQCDFDRAVGEDPVLRCARPAPPTTPSNPAPRRPHQPPTRIQEMATAASSHSAAQAAPAGRSDCGSLC